MGAVGIEMLKDRLSAYARLAAEAGPPPQQQAEPLPDGLLAHVVREGLITSATLPGFAASPAPVMMTPDEPDHSREAGGSRSTPRWRWIRAARSIGIPIAGLD